MLLLILRRLVAKRLIQKYQDILTSTRRGIQSFSSPQHLTQYSTQDILNNITDISGLLVKEHFENLIHTLLPLIYTNNKAINKSYDGNSTLLKLFSLIHNPIWKNKEM